MFHTLNDPQVCASEQHTGLKGRAMLVALRVATVMLNMDGSVPT